MQLRYNFGNTYNKLDGLLLHPMKFLAFIMAFLVLALSVLPCADSSNAATDSKAKTVTAKSNQQKDNPQQDDCSPFCHCTCCAGFSINHFIAVINLRLLPISKTATAYFSAKTNNITLPIWQPPKLSASIIA